jgi:hypothetical protein
LKPLREKQGPWGRTVEKRKEERKRRKRRLKRVICRSGRRRNKVDTKAKRNCFLWFSFLYSEKHHSTKMTRV